MEQCYMLIIIFFCSVSFSPITALNIFQILTGPERCHKNFPAWWKSHTTLSPSTIPQQPCPQFWCPVVAQEKLQTPIQKNLTADLNYTSSVHEFLLMHFSCHRQLSPDGASFPAYNFLHFTLIELLSLL